MVILFGIVTGTYSSIFIAGPLLMFGLRPGGEKAEDKPISAAPAKAK